ncbi:hypothetical protein CDAR_64201 [Caerostris darwini]|uniref:Uncharacterized protein n=1 Tax=Caerostris darwini TaxID=1538125 RepID=A0AAV4R7U7_9ARAC|nr:hypothetical protein CDAR_64201 [Caerostris darwini]
MRMTFMWTRLSPSCMAYMKRGQSFPIEDLEGGWNTRDFSSAMQKNSKKKKNDAWSINNIYNDVNKIFSLCCRKKNRYVSDGMSLSGGMFLFRPFEKGTVPPAVYPVIVGPLKGTFCDNRGYSGSENAPGINEGDKAALLTVNGFESTSRAFSQTILIEARVFLLQ